jgi:hypothetical protein
MQRPVEALLDSVLPLHAEGKMPSAVLKDIMWQAIVSQVREAADDQIAQSG